MIRLNIPGSLITVTVYLTPNFDGNGNRAELRYDGHGRQDRWTFPSATRPPAYNDADQASALASAGSANGGDYEEYAYDAAGNRTSLRKRDSSVLTYQYDNLNRMIVKIVPSRAGLTAAQTRDVYYGYDLRDLPLYARFDSATGEGITNVYDAARHPNGIGRPGSTTGLAFRADGPLLSLSHYIGAPLDVRWTFTPNPAGQIASVTRNQ
jgi:YD repeat-containing protein